MKKIYVINAWLGPGVHTFYYKDRYVFEMIKKDFIEKGVDVATCTIKPRG